MPQVPRTALGRLVDELEQTLIAVLLGLMTLITFANVVARYAFNSNILWALEATVFLFAWLVLLGASHVVKINGHLGVDAVVRLLPPNARRVATLLAAGACLAFSALLMIGAWQYWSSFVGRYAWYEVQDIPMPAWLRFIEPWLNEGEAYEKLPRFIAYFALPLGMALLTFRFLQVTWRIWRGDTTLLVASHEVEKLLEAEAPGTLSSSAKER